MGRSVKPLIQLGNMSSMSFKALKKHFTESVTFTCPYSLFLFSFFCSIKGQSKEAKKESKERNKDTTLPHFSWYNPVFPVHRIHDIIKASNYIFHNTYKTTNVKKNKKIQIL